MRKYYYRPKDLKFARNLLIPKKGTVYDHVYIKRQYGSWNQWSSLITQFSIDEKAKVTLPVFIRFHTKCHMCFPLENVFFEMTTYR
jgi:hypothetical protein